MRRADIFCNTYVWRDQNSPVIDQRIINLPDAFNIFVFIDFR